MISDGAIDSARQIKEIAEKAIEEVTGDTAREDGPTRAYNRRKHYGSTPKKSDRNALNAGKDEVVDHDPPLVKRYYEGDPRTGEPPGYTQTAAERRASANDRSRMQRQPKSESNAQGGTMSGYSKQKHGL